MATEKRKKREAKVKVKAKTKVTIVTGFLGSGKTTFIKHVIKGIRGTSGQGRSHKDKVKIAAIVNDFAEFNVDAELVGALHAEPGHSSLFMLTGKERNIFVFPISSLANVSQWRTALGRETFVVLSNLVDPQQQALYSN